MLKAALWEGQEDKAKMQRSKLENEEIGQRNAAAKLTISKNSKYEADSAKYKKKSWLSIRLSCGRLIKMSRLYQGGPLWTWK